MVNLHIYPSAFKFESRILKETKTVVRNDINIKVIIISIHEPSLQQHEKIDEQREVYRLQSFSNNKSKNKILKGINYLEFFVRVILKFLFKKVHIINCHSLTVLPIGVLFKIFKGSKLIYDTHELETERESLSGVSKKIMEILERICIKSCDRVIVVNRSIGQWYKERYSLNDVYIVKNVPYQVSLNGHYNKFRDAFAIPDISTIYLYQGYLNAGRAIDFLLEVFSTFDQSKHIVFMGYGDYEGEIKSYSEKYQNIHFHPAVPMDTLPFYTASADVGISLTEKPCLSYRFALGNKFFEFINAEIPFIFWDGFIEVKLLNDQYDFGWSVAKDNLMVTSLINSLGKVEIAEKKRNVRNCKPNFDWLHEEKEIKRAYEFGFSQ